MGNFWRGEFVWHGTLLASPAMDPFYTVSSAILLIAAIIGFAWLNRKTGAKERIADALGFVVVGASVLALVALSIRFDFGNCMAPSHLHPYFSQARTIGGITVPFLVFYVKGLDLIMSKLRLNVSRTAVLAVIAVVMTAADAYISLPVFASPYNWFHMF
jgi:hypothetical protein